MIIVNSKIQIKKKRAGIKPPPNYHNDNEDNEDGSGSELQQYDN